MSSSLDDALRDLVRDVLREELAVALAAQQPVPSSTPRAKGGLAAMPDEYVSTKQAAEIAGVCPATVRTWIQQGHLRGHRAGRLVRVRLDDLRTFMARATTGRAEVIDLDARAREILARPRRTTTGSRR